MNVVIIRARDIHVGLRPRHRDKACHALYSVAALRHLLPPVSAADRLVRRAVPMAEGQHWIIEIVRAHARVPSSIDGFIRIRRSFRKADEVTAGKTDKTTELALSKGDSS